MAASICSIVSGALRRDRAGLPTTSNARQRSRTRRPDARARGGRSSAARRPRPRWLGRRRRRRQRLAGRRRPRGASTARRSANGCKAATLFMAGIPREPCRHDGKCARYPRLVNTVARRAMTCHGGRAAWHHCRRVDRHALPPRRRRVRRRPRRRRRARARRRRGADRAAGGRRRQLRARCASWRTATGWPTRSASIRCAPTRPATPTWRRCATRSTRHRDDPRLVAVGEIGLDHFVAGPRPRAPGSASSPPSSKLAREFELPVLLHVRRVGRHAAQAAAPRPRARAASRTPSTAASSRPRRSSSSASGSASAAP